MKRKRLMHSQIPRYEWTLRARSVVEPIGLSPYFAARTKRGKPYKRRERELKAMIARGLTDYIRPVYEMHYSGDWSNKLFGGMWKRKIV